MLLLKVKLPRHIFIISLFIISHYKCESKNYCGSEYCNNSKQHVLCKFQFPGPANSCLDYRKIIETDKDKQDILDRINGRRNKVASGEIRSLPSAENMYRMVWSEELEVLAQRWADQCISNSLLDESDSCRDFENNTHVGQNVATIYGESPGLTAAALVDLWYMELLNVNASILNRFRPSTLTLFPHYEYFTQLTWAESTQVGCGGVTFKESELSTVNKKKRTVYKLVCNFLPGGNINDQPVYASGSPCSRCSHGCDSEYTSLCVSGTHTKFNNIQENIRKTENNIQDIYDYVTVKKLTSNRKTEATTIGSLKITDVISDNDTNFDFLSHLFEVTITRPAIIEQSTPICKENIAVDELIKLFKNRFSTDQSLKDLLITSLPSFETNFSDATVAAIVNKLYSKKTVTTMSTSTVEENLNSTLLADLVEAVIFRHADKFSTIEDSSLRTQIAPSVIPVKIQAELGEVRTNNDFTGHYFFPEEEEKIETETTEVYDDVESLPVSEISFEIENLKRHRETKDFLDDILESDFMTESIVKDRSVLSENNVIIVPNVKKEIENSSTVKINSIHDYKRIKRRLSRHSSKIAQDGILTKYRDLLRKLATDLRMLHLNKKFYCASNSMENQFNEYSYLIIILYYLV